MDVNGPYRETKVLYAILNPTLPYQTARISKGFLSDGRSALDIAKNSPDSSLYDPSILRVRLLEFNNTGQVRKSYPMFPTTIPDKQSGIFYYPDQLVYRTADTLIDTNARFKLVVENLRTGNVSEATTDLVGSNTAITSYIPDRPGDPFVIRFSSVNPSAIRLRRSRNAAMMEAVLDWKISVEREINGQKDTVIETWSWTSPGLLSLLENNPEATGIIGSGAFWGFLRQEIQKRGNANVLSRQFLPSQLLVTMVNRDFENYRLVNGNYNVITQSIPIYTNVSNGLGIVCSRNQRSFVTVLDRSTRDSVRLRVPEFRLK